MSIVVRDGNLEDIEACQQICRKAFEPLRKIYHPKKEALRQRDRNENAQRRLVAVKDGQIVGVVSYYVQGGRLCLFALAVLPDCQNCGIARLLIDSLANRARALGIELLQAMTIEQTGNVTFFQRMGFEVEESFLATLFESDQFRSLMEVRMVRKVTTDPE